MVSPVLSERAQRLIEYADDELILGWRDSEWTGIAPSLEEDVAFSSIAQNEIGHARALYELAARDLGTTADELAFDRSPDEYRCAPLVELRKLDWAHTIARHWLYETADELRLAALKETDDAEVAGLAAKMDREEIYHRLHAQRWADRLRHEPRFQQAVAALWPYALGVVANVHVDGDHVRVEFTPTFLGCPALQVMRDAMPDKVRALGAQPQVEVVLDDS